MLGARHDPRTLTKHRDPIFASDGDLRKWVEDGADPGTLLAPRLEITKLDKFADWIEERSPDVWAQSRSPIAGQ
ncbi:MAG: hypothetical protein HC869_07665 [Rhodospirillales bacterium]|nr:hypothetical protein [Rhodospirillales bacterium]